VAEAVAPVLSGAPLWEARDVSKTFPGVRALDRVSLSLNVGEVHALVGENGSGKSTLVKCLSGIYQPDEGELLHRGSPVELRDPAAAHELGVATFYQELSLVPSLTVAENIHLGRLPRRGGLIRWSDARREARAALRRLRVAIDPDRVVSTLSVAEQQLVEIAKATSRSMSLLILDEPTAALGPREAQRLHEVIRLLAEQQVCVLYISHRLEEVLTVSDWISVLRDGAVVGRQRAGESSVRELARMMIGREPESYFRREHETATQAPLLEARELRTKAGANGVSFTVHAGEVLGLGGLIGSGRTEIARALFGADRVVEGELLLDGKPLRLREPADAIAAGIALIPENRKADGLFFNLLAPPNVTIARLDSIARGRFLSLGRERSSAGALLHDVGLVAHSQERSVGFLSGGNQQKVMLARWLFAKSRLLILDEPTQGVDVGAKREVYQLIDDLTQRGVGVVLISSDYPELLSLSDRVAVVNSGRIVHVAERGELSKEELIERASTRVQAAAG
jgi:ribose transport system ATP-binding protein